MARARTDPKVALRQQLDAVVARFPTLAPLRAELGPDDSISTPFLESYVRCSVTGALRQRLLMAALGDRSERSERPELTPEIAERTLFFLEHHPTRPLSPWSNRFKRELIPQRLRRMYDLDAERSSSSNDLRPRLDACEFLRRALVQPAFEAALVAARRPETDRDMRDSTRVSHLRRLLSAFVLTPEEARRLLIEPRARHAFTHFFHTGQPLLDVRNALQFYLPLLERIDFEASSIGKTSRRIDQTLLGLPRRGSHPLIALMTQLIALGILGLIQPRRGPWCDPHLGPVLGTLRESAHVFEIEAIARRHLDHWILDSTSIDRWHTALAVNGPNARYTRSILFDPQFVLDKAAPSDGPHTLRRHYAHIDTPALREYLLSHYARTDPDFAKRLALWCGQAPEIFAGVRLRALANALYYARFLEERGEDPRVALPVAAKVALGAARSAATRSRRPMVLGARRGPIRQRPERRTWLPLLEQLARSPAPARRLQSRPPAPKPVQAAKAPSRKPPSVRRRSAPPPSLAEIGELLGRIRTSRAVGHARRRSR